MWFNFSSIFYAPTGTSSVARGLSVYLDALIDNRMSKLFHDLFPMSVDFLASYPDFFSFIVVIMLSLLLSVGVKESSILNNIFTTINVATVILVIGSGAMKCKSNIFSQSPLFSGIHKNEKENICSICSVVSTKISFNICIYKQFYQNPHSGLNSRENM